MEVQIERENRTEKLDFEGKAIDLVKKLGLNIQEVIISRNGKIITEDAKLEKDDKIVLLSVISGG